MSGSDNRRPPKDDKELAREFDRRISSLEHPSATRVGKWVLSTGDSGELLASYVEGGSVSLSPPPVVGDSPDETESEDQEPPLLFLERTDLQDINGGQVTRIEWNQVVQQIGTWGITGSDPHSDIEIPVTGYYIVTVNVAMGGDRNNLTQAVVQIDGDDTHGSFHNPSGTVAVRHNIAFQAYLEAEQTVGVWVYGSDNNNVGKVSDYRTRLDINCLRRSTEPDYEGEDEDDG